MFQHQLLPHEKWPRQQAGAGEAQLSLPQPPPGREELPASEDQPSELLADALLWEQLAQEERMTAEATHSRHSAAAALGYSATAAHDPLDTLREAAWQATKDKAQAKEAVLVACAHATSQLPGSWPQLLGVAPAVFVLLLGNPERARPAGVLLVQVPTAYGAPSSSSDGSGSSQRWSEAHTEEHVLRVLVYCPKTGTLLEHRDWLLKEEHHLADHPLFGLPCWDSRDGWQLLFPDPLDEPHQATMFAATIAAYGAAQPPPYTACPLPPPTSFSPAFSRTCTSPRMPSQPVQQLVEPDLSQTQLFQLDQSQHELPGPHLLPTFSAEEVSLLEEVLSSGDVVPPGSLLAQPAEQQAATPPPPARRAAKRKQRQQASESGGAPPRSMMCHQLAAQKRSAAVQLAQVQPVQRQEQQATVWPYQELEPAFPLLPPLKLPRRTIVPPPCAAHPQRFQQQRPAFAAPSQLQPFSPRGVVHTSMGSFGSSGTPAAAAAAAAVDRGSQQLPPAGSSGYMASTNLCIGLRSGGPSAHRLPGLLADDSWLPVVGSCSLPAPAPLAPDITSPHLSAAWAPQQPAANNTGRCDQQPAAPSHQPRALQLSGGSAAPMPTPPAEPFAAASQLPAFDAVPSRCSAGQDAAAGTVQHGPLPLPPAPMVAPPLPPVVEPAQTPAAVKWQPPTPMKQAHGTAYPSPSPGSGSRAAPSPAPASVDAELLQLLDWEDELDGSYRRAVVTLRNRAVSTAALLRH